MEFEVYRKSCMICGSKRKVFIGGVEAENEQEAIKRVQNKWSYERFGQAGAVTPEETSEEEQFLDGEFYAEEDRN